MRKNALAFYKMDKALAKLVQHFDELAVLLAVVGPLEIDHG